MTTIMTVTGLFLKMVYIIDPELIASHAQKMVALPDKLYLQSINAHQRSIDAETMTQLAFTVKNECFR